ncbi:MAG: hypothetical protein LBG74_06545 [Spirochaetaceae bacterium]|jgi:hypothetical protein|nr:hypothetical protein [Spirochaetaceae bacterium]
MSVRATRSLIADLVQVSGISNSPKMVVKDVNEEEKIVTAVWFNDEHSFQTGDFPAQSLDRVEIKAPAKGRK